MKKENDRLIAGAIGDLIEAVSRLEEKVDACNGFCEQILDEVVPLGLAIDAIVADTEATA